MPPRIFISSTVVDLGDVRSAVRYFIEQLGFEVLTSESPDFPHALENEAWQAALVPIDSADYFVLLIGARAGWITPQGISVTRAEFRRARDLHRSSGRPKVVVFAREDTLRAYKSQGSADPEGFEDWPSIRAFLDEIREGQAEADSTWIHGFSTFEEIAVALRTALRLSGSLRRRIQEANLIQEFFSNGEALLVRVREVLAPKSNLLVRVPKTVNELDRNALSSLVFFRLILPGPGSMSTVAIQDAISSGEFLEFDSATGAMQLGPVHRGLLTLRQRISRFASLVSILGTEPYIREFASMTPNGGSRRPSTEFLEAIWAVRDELENIERLTRSIARFLLGRDTVWQEPAMNPPVPNAVEAARIESESIDRIAVDAWLSSPEDARPS